MPMYLRVLGSTLRSKFTLYWFLDYAYRQRTGVEVVICRCFDGIYTVKRSIEHSTFSSTSAPFHDYDTRVSNAARTIHLSHITFLPYLFLSTRVVIPVATSRLMCT